MNSIVEKNNIALNNSDLWKELELNEIRYWSTIYKAAKEKMYNASNIGYVNIDNGDVFTGWMSDVDILAYNRTLGIGLNKSANPYLLDLIISKYKRAGVPRFFVQVCPAAKPEDIHFLLTDKGFLYYNNWVKLYRDRNKKIPEVKTNLSIERVKKEHARLFGKIITEAFDWPVHLQEVFANSVGEPGYYHYFANLNDIPVAAAALYIHDKYASMAIAGTLPQFRGQGAQNLLLAHRMRDAMDLGCQHIISETAEETVEKQVQSFRNMRKLGFEVAYKRPNYIYYN